MSKEQKVWFKWENGDVQTFNKKHKLTQEEFDLLKEEFGR